MWWTKRAARDFSIYARASDKALDEAYEYGRATPGSFGEACNRAGAEAVVRAIERTKERNQADIEHLADVSHDAWSEVAKVFDDPIYKKNPEKKVKRLKLASTPYSELPEEEKEKDRVAVRAILKQWLTTAP